MMMIFPNELNCKICMLGKNHVQLFPKQSLSRSDAPLSLVHTEICGPMKTSSIGGARYFVSFIDDFSRKIFVYFLKST